MRVERRASVQAPCRPDSCAAEWSCGKDRSSGCRLQRGGGGAAARPKHAIKLGEAAGPLSDWGANESSGAKLKTHSFRIICLGITWKGTSVFDFARTFAVASAAAAMLFMLALTLGLISPSSRPAGVVQAVAQQH